MLIGRLGLSFHPLNLWIETIYAEEGFKDYERAGSRHFAGDGIIEDKAFNLMNVLNIYYSFSGIPSFLNCDKERKSPNFDRAKAHRSS
jgi:hypothetical protein